VEGDAINKLWRKSLSMMAIMAVMSIPTLNEYMTQDY